MTDPSALEDLGYSDHWRALFAPYEARGLEPARVVRSARGGSIVTTAAGPRRAKPSAALLRSAGEAGLPAVGDWVAVLAGDDLDVPLVEAVLERSGAIARGDPGENSGPQVLAANVDVVFVVHSIAAAPNLRRIERELSLAWESDAVPVVVLTKADLSVAPEETLADVLAVALGVEVLVTSAPTGAGLEALLAAVGPRRTAALIGPSGAGKSTLVNALLGEERQATREVRVADGRGRHTTVDRELIRLANGSLIVDTPGLRSLGLTGGEEGIAAVFADVEAAAAGCRFRDCAHDGEPGCAVAAAVEAGTMPAERLGSYQKLVREARVAAMKTDARLRAEEQRRWKSVAKARRYYQETGKG